jgi:hypothetical protein
MKKTLIVLVAALALLGVILFKRGSDRKALGQDVPVLDSAKKAEVVSFRIAKLADTVSIARKDGAWGVGKDAWLGDTAKINRALGHLFSLQAKEKVSQNESRLKEYGLDSSEAKHVVITGKDGKAMAEVVIGKTSGADYSSTYWKWEGKPEVYRTPGNFSYEIGVKEDEWKERKLFGFQAKDIRFLEASWKDTTGASFAYKLEATSDTTWKMLEPVDSNRVVKHMAADAASRFSEMAVDEFIGSADTNVAKAKLDSATLWAKVTLKDGKSHEISAGRPYDNYFYVKHPGRADFVKLSSWRFDNLKKKPFELLEAPPPPADTAATAQGAAPAAAGAASAATGDSPGHEGHGH